jgi:urea carboxylase
VAEGESVSAGQTLMILESMKMEIEIHAQQAGKITKVLVGEGHDVQAGQCLIWLEQQKEANDD